MNDTGMLGKFAAIMGDFEFSCEREPDNTVLWYKKLLNTPGAQPERVCLTNVPRPILAAFSAAQVTRQVIRAQNQAAAH